MHGTTENILIALSIIFLLGIGSQWLAWRIQLPSILLLLLFGVIAGPLLGILEPDQLFGPALQPIVSVSVAIILFEGGLHLKLQEIGLTHRAVRNLLTIGVLVTWALATVFAFTILNLEWRLSLLLGAILIVTGPTVVIPLLRYIRPKDQVNSILKWEGILIDPIGAILAVIIFEAILVGKFEHAAGLVALGVLKSLLVGTFLGALGAGLIYLVVRQHWLPGYLHNPVNLTLIICFFTLSNLFQSESGLITTTLMGILLANQRSVDVKHILEFNTNLQVLLLSSLFVILAARLNVDDFALLDINAFFFILALIFIVRPVSVFISTWRTSLSWQEKILISWMAPRGIVAAAIASITAIRLVEDGFSDAARFIPIVFAIIMVTIIVYGLTSLPLVRLLGLKGRKPQGVLLVGANRWAVRIAEELRRLNHHTVLLDLNMKNIQNARDKGLIAINGNILADSIMEDIDFGKIGYMIAMTPSENINSLAVLRFSNILGEKNVFQLEPDSMEAEPEILSSNLTGRVVFHPALRFSELARRLRLGAEIRKHRVEEEVSDLDTFLEMPEHQGAICLFILHPSDKTLTVSTHSKNHPLQTGDILVYLSEASSQ